MDPYPLVLLANEPAAYRSLLAAELPFLRPNLRVLEINPADLDAALKILHPAVIVCSRTPAYIRSEVSVLVLHSDEVDASLRSLDATITNPRLADILGAIDRAVSSRNADASARHQDD